MQAQFEHYLQLVNLCLIIDYKAHFDGLGMGDGAYGALPSPPADRTGFPASPRPAR